jgi:putative peptide zinc metalloprotease protein
VHSGYALKRLDASEGERRWVFGDRGSGRFLRLSDSDAELLQLLDGRRTLVELVGEAERVAGPDGPALLARLLAELGERGLLAGIEGTPGMAASDGRGLLTPREWNWSGAGDLFERLYRAGGRRLFTEPALAVVAVLIVAGLVAFPYLVVGRYGTPFVVASHLGLGGLVFLAGRFAVAAVHETAHGLAMARCGRRVRRAGLKLVVIFPYAFVDTSEAWFESRRRRIAISAAGPVSDLSLGALFAVTCLTLPEGSVRDVFFQLAFAAYLGAVFNLNPFIERDGYHVLVDVLREPSLRRRAREQLARRLRGEGAAGDSVVLRRYALLGLAWLAVAGCFAVGMSLRYRPVLEDMVGTGATWVAMTAVWLAVFAPLVLALGAPLAQRWRREPAT